MRLIPKSEIATAKSKDRERDVAEGVKIARRIDSLREVQAEEEASLKRFREKTLAAIKADTEAEQAVLDTLKEEVSILEARRKDALRPLNDKEAELDATEQRIVEETVALNKREEKLALEKRILAEARQSTMDELSRAQTKHDIAQSLLQEAANKASAATVALKEAEMAKANVDRRVDAINASLGHREGSIAARERNQSLRDASQDKREQELNARETRLIDRERQLERNIKRFQ